MAKKEEFSVDTDELDIPMVKVEPKETANFEEKYQKRETVKRINAKIDPDFNPLRNERIIVRLIPKTKGIWGDNPKHVLAGGMAETSVRTFVVPRLNSGMFVNVLTDQEKTFLEEYMGLEYNALSIYKKKDNFWDDSNEEGINKVDLTKGDTYLNLSNPEDYIKYKILLANKNFIAPSLKFYQDYPKSTYQYVLIEEGDEAKMAKANMSFKMQCYKEFGKIEDDVDILRTIIETIEGKPTSANSKIEFLQNKINDLIQLDAKMFLRVITDKTLPTKVFIKKCIENGLIAKRGDFLYLRSDNTPLCENGEEPTISVAAAYLNSPKHQELKFALEAKLKN